MSTEWTLKLRCDHPDCHETWIDNSKVGDNEENNPYERALTQGWGYELEEPHGDLCPLHAVKSDD